MKQAASDMIASSTGRVANMSGLLADTPNRRLDISAAEGTRSFACSSR